MRVLLAVVCLCLSVALSADTVLLKSGRELKGSIRYQDSEVIHLESGGRVQIIRKKEIRRMRFEAPSSAPAKSDADKKREEDARKEKLRTEAQKQAAEKQRQERELERQNRERRAREARLKREAEEKEMRRRVLEREAAEKEAAEKESAEKARIESEKKAAEEKLASDRMEREKAAEKEAAEKEAAEKARRDLEEAAAREKEKELKAAEEKQRLEMEARQKAEAEIREKQAREEAMRRKIDEEKRASEERLWGGRYFLAGASIVRGTVQGAAVETALYNMQSYSRFTGGLGIRERFRGVSQSSSSSTSSSTNGSSNLRASLDGTDGSAAGSSTSLSPFGGGTHPGLRLDLGFVTGAWKFALSGERLSARNYQVTDLGIGFAGPPGASGVASSFGTAFLAEKRTSGIFTVQYSLLRKEMLDLFVIGGVQSRTHDVWGLSIAAGSAGGVSGGSVIAEEKAGSSFRGLRFGAGWQLAGTTFGIYNRLEVYSMSGSLHASAVGAGRFFSFTPQSPGPALPSIDQSGREGGIVLTFGFFARLFSRTYLTLEYAAEGSTFRPSETKTFGLDFSSDGDARVLGALVPGWYTGNPLLARPPYRASFRTVSAGLSVRFDWDRKK